MICSGSIDVECKDAGVCFGSCIQPSLSMSYDFIMNIYAMLGMLGTFLSEYGGSVELTWFKDATSMLANRF